jgi:hypothetical protein
MPNGAEIIDLIRENKYQASQPTNQSPTNTGIGLINSLAGLPGATTNEDINIIKDYPWTYSNNILKKIDDIPYIQVKEFKMAGNSYISSLMTSAMLFPDLAGGFFNKIESSFKDNKFKDFISSDTANTIQKLSNKASAYADNILTQIKGIDNTADEWNNDDLKSKYAYLYLRRPTGRKYKFPYFDSDYISISNTFEDTYNQSKEQNPFTDMLDQVSNLATRTVKMFNAQAATEPGSYIQRPKYYSFENSGSKVKVVFFLFNTTKENAYLSNLDLITKLVIQNTPHRHNRILVDPPCLYELTIPGKGFYPYTFVSSLDVQHVGTKRMLETNTGRKAIIPDAFKVSIEFSSLTMDVNNFMIPEMGTAWINVNQRFGLNSSNTSTKNQTIMGQSQTIDSGASSGSTPAVVNSGSSSTSQNNATFPQRSIMNGGGFSPVSNTNDQVISPY